MFDLITLFWHIAILHPVFFSFCLFAVIWQTSWATPLVVGKWWWNFSPSRLWSEFAYTEVVEQQETDWWYLRKIVTKGFFTSQDTIGSENVLGSEILMSKTIFVDLLVFGFLSTSMSNPSQFLSTLMV